MHTWKENIFIGTFQQVQDEKSEHVSVTVTSLSALESHQR